MFREKIVKEFPYEKSLREEFIEEIMFAYPDPITDEEREQLLKLLDMKWI